jgi:hypothetical protein
LMKTDERDALDDLLGRIGFAKDDNRPKS